MSSRKRPLAEAQQSQLTPSRYAPSTPHALRALQQRSGNRLRSIRTIKTTNNDSIRLDSARGILKRLAKITAPATKKTLISPASVVVDKENLPWQHDEEEYEALELQQPKFTLALEDTIDDDSELPVAPTPSILPEDDIQLISTPNVTFQNIRDNSDSISNRETFRRRRSQSAALAEADRNEEYEDGNTTIMTERGRRAISEEATGRLSRYSFGSIRMDDFGSQLEVSRHSGIQKNAIDFNMVPDFGIVHDGNHFDLDDTEALEILRSSSSPSIEGINVPDLSALDNETFHLPVPEVIEPHAVDVSQHNQSNELQQDQHQSQKISPTDSPRSGEQPFDVQKTKRRQTLLEASSTTADVRRSKRLRMTRHGHTVPSLPLSLIKRVALETQTKSGRRRPTLGKDHLQALEQATEWFFEQVGSDLEVYSSHGRRKKRIDTDDALLLMRRQKMLIEDGQLRKLAQDWLPQEILKELDLPDAP